MPIDPATSCLEIINLLEIISWLEISDLKLYVRHRGNRVS
jgi:hypothetical protein